MAFTRQLALACCILQIGFSIQSNVYYATLPPTAIPSEAEANSITPVHSAYKPTIASPSELHRIYNDHDMHEYHYYDRMDYRPYGSVVTKHSSFKSFWPALILLTSVPSSIISLFTIPILISLLMHMLKQIIMTQNTINQGLASQGGMGMGGMGGGGGGMGMSPGMNEPMKRISANLHKAVEKFTSKSA